MSHDSKLTLEARQAIRGYILHLVAIPGALLTVLAFALGFFINDVAVQKANTDAYKDASSKILDIISFAADKASDAEVSANEAKQIADSAKAVLSDVETVKTGLTTAAVFQQSEDLVKEVANNLANRPDFKNIVGGDITARIASLENSASKERLPSRPLVLKGEMPWGAWTGASYCPDKHYVCGLEQKVEPKQSDGDDTAVNGVRFFCCPL